MPTPPPAIVLAKVDDVYVRSVTGKIFLTDSEPCTCDVSISSWDGLYGPDSDVAQIRETAPRILVFYIVERVGSSLQIWQSPDFIVEDYEIDWPLANLSGRCRLAELDDDDRFIVWNEETGSGTVKSGSLPDVLAAIAGAGGLEVTGADDRTVRDYNLAGNLLSLFSDLLYPIQKFWMGEGTEIVCSATTVGTNTYTDQDYLKSFRFRRSRYVRNQAVVERLERGGGPIELASGEREAASGLAGTSDLIALSEPSRSLWIEWECARGNMYWSAYDESGDPLNPPLAPLDNARYQGSVLATHVRFEYELGPDADNGDDWRQRYRFTVWGWPSGAVEPPVEGYTKIGNAGSGPRRRFPQPFSLPSIDTASDAQAAANAIAEQGNEEGTSISFGLALTANVPRPVSVANVTDARTPWDGSGKVKTTEITWDERTGAGGIAVEASVSE